MSAVRPVEKIPAREGPTRRPQLTLEELHQLKWLLGGVLTLLAVWTVFYMEIEAWWLMLAATLAAGATLWRPTLPSKVPAMVHTLAFPVIVAFFAVDLWVTAEVLPPVVRLGIFLLLYRSISYRQRRDDLQVIVLGLFLIVVAGVLTVSLLFALQILIYTACALGFLLVITLADTAGGRQKPVPHRAGELPAWAAHVEWRRLFRRVREVADWRVVAMGGGLFAGVVALSAVLFLAIPRFQLENSLFLDRFITKKSKTGFSDVIRFGDVSEIQQDTSIALSVDVTDSAKVPASPYWRMLLLDDYRDGTFRFSPILRSLAFGPERTGMALRGESKPRLGEAVYWTFYLESGVSRFLPLLGEFERMQFREPQNFRLAAELNVVALRDEPVSMTAYRVEGLDTSGVLRDPTFAKRWKERDPAESPKTALQVRLTVGAADRARLAEIVSEIMAGAPKLGAGEFARRTEAWLVKNHSYSLAPRTPPGDGDPLVRWLTSREAGHCELFAGSLVLLARAAGFPARVVTGFRGGSWNAYSNNFTIRNSDAHAWAEVFDEVAGSWLRADALGVAAAAQASEVNRAAALAARVDRSWSARLDSLRVFWYRRIVNFDQTSQVETLRAVKTATQNSGRWIKEALDELNVSLKKWVAGPWDGARLIRVGATAVILVGTVWWWFAVGRAWVRRRWQWRSARGGDPLRAVAGRWLAEIADSANRMAAPHELTAVIAPVVADLQRVRFGARETWPEPEAVFRRARQALREARATTRAEGGRL
jgi:transglutaminase-like putative cysteine protease